MTYRLVAQFFYHDQPIQVVLSLFEGTFFMVLCATIDILHHSAAQAQVHYYYFAPLYLVPHLTGIEQVRSMDHVVDCCDTYQVAPWSMTYQERKKMVRFNFL